MRISTAQYFETSAAKYQNNFSSIVSKSEQPFGMHLERR